MDDLTAELDEAEAVVMGRAETAEVTHQCPPGDGGLAPCCGMTPFELPRTDRITEDEALVTCRRPFLPDWTLAPGDCLAELARGAKRSAR